MSRRTIQVAAAVCVVLAACGGGAGGGSGGGPAQVTASTELEGDAPFAVEATDPGPVADEDVEHEIVFTVEGDRGVVIGDVRWTFGELIDGAAFATAGHGCDADIEQREGRDEIVHVCTEEFRTLVVRPDEPLHETVTVSGPLGGRSIAEGTFAFEQPVRWWYADTTEGGADDPVELPAGDPDGEATILVVYEVARDG